MFVFKGGRVHGDSSPFKVFTFEKKEKVITMGPLILVMLISRVHICPYQLNDEATP